MCLIKETLCTAEHSLNANGAPYGVYNTLCHLFHAGTQSIRLTLRCQPQVSSPGEQRPQASSERLASPSRGAGFLGTLILILFPTLWLIPAPPNCTPQAPLPLTIQKFESYDTGPLSALSFIIWVTLVGLFNLSEARVSR